MKRALIMVVVLVMAGLFVGCAGTPVFQETGRVQLNNGWQAVGTHKHFNNPFGEEYAGADLIIDPPEGGAVLYSERVPVQQAPQQIAKPAVPQQMPRELKDAKLRWVPPAEAAPPQPPARPVYATATQYAQPHVGSSIGGNGPGFMKAVVPSALRAGGDVGASALAPGVDVALTAVNKGGKMVQKQGQISNNTNVNKNKNNIKVKSGSSSSSSSAVAVD